MLRVGLFFLLFEVCADFIAVRAIQKLNVFPLVGKFISKEFTAGFCCCFPVMFFVAFPVRFCERELKVVGGIGDSCWEYWRVGRGIVMSVIYFYCSVIRAMQDMEKKYQTEGGEVNKLLLPFSSVDGISLIIWNTFWREFNLRYSLYDYANL